MSIRRQRIGEALRHDLASGPDPVHSREVPHACHTLTRAHAFPRALQARTPKIIVSKVALRPQCFEDALGEYVGAYTTYVFERALPLGALVAVLNSSLMAFVFRLLYDALAMGGGYLRFQPPQMRRLPIPSALTNAAASAVSVARLAKLATQSASLRDAASVARTPGEGDSLRRQIVALDAEIDRLVCDLYRLSDDEIALVEAL